MNKQCEIYVSLQVETNKTPDTEHCKQHQSINVELNEIAAGYSPAILACMFVILDILDIHSADRSSFSTIWFSLIQIK